MSKKYPQQAINRHFPAGMDCGFAYRGHHFLNPDFSPSPFLVGDVQSYPKLDISEDEGNITIKAELPGIETKDFNILIEGRRLTLKGKKRHAHKKKNERYHRIEMSYGRFGRTIKLPAKVNQNTITAKYRKGILTIKLEKVQKTELKRIHVSMNE